MTASQSRSQWIWITPVFAIALIALAPLVLNPYQLSVVLLIYMYVALSCSWNVIGGYAGYFTFGHVAYFGIGAYTAALLVTQLHMYWLVAAAFAGLLATAIAAAIGYPSLKFKGPAFVIITLAFSQSLRVAVYIFDEWTGGGRGMSLPPVQSLIQVYFAFGAAAILAVAATWFLDRSAFGRRLKAIRDDEFAAEAIGVNTQREKLKAFMLSAVLPGFCGGVYAWYLGYINPEESFSMRINVSMIVMVLLGGAGTVMGPVIGAVIVFLVSEMLWAQFPALHELVFGVTLMGLILFAPGGLIGLAQRRLALKRGG